MHIPTFVSLEICTYLVG